MPGRRWSDVDGHMRLQTLVSELRGLPDNYHVSYDWDMASPDIKRFCADRGHPEDLSLGVCTTFPSVTSFIGALEACLGKTFEAWKGGSQTCDGTTLLTAGVAELHGHAIVGWRDTGYSVELITHDDEKGLAYPNYTSEEEDSSRKEKENMSKIELKSVHDLRPRDILSFGGKDYEVTPQTLTQDCPISTLCSDGSARDFTEAEAEDIMRFGRASRPVLTPISLVQPR